GGHRDHRPRGRSPCLAGESGGHRPPRVTRWGCPAYRPLAGRRGGGRMSGLTDGPLLWYLNRSPGLVVLALLTVSALLGVLSTGGAGRVVPRFATQAVHRNLALWSVALLGLHVVTAVVDTYVDIRWWQAV